LSITCFGKLQTFSSFTAKSKTPTNVLKRGRRRRKKGEEKEKEEESNYYSNINLITINQPFPAKF